MLKKILVMMTILLVLVGCATGNNNNNTGNNNAGNDNEGPVSNVINVYTRDATSGTREAFEGGIGLGDDALTADAVETSGNGDMAAKVGADAQAVGYVSLTTDFDANNLTAVHFEGVEPTIENVLSEEYTLSRPFSITSRAKGDFETDKHEQVVAAFVDFIMNSTEGLLAVEAAGGIVDVDDSTVWADLASAHSVLEGDVSDITIRTAGSTSVEKTLEAALQAFQAETGVQFAMAHTGSGDGFRRVLGSEKDGANAADLGFASRGFDTEGDEPQATLDTALVADAYALDAVVVVVNADNTSVTSLSAQQVEGIYSGTITDWSEVQ